MTAGTELRTIADSYADDIETADEIAREFLGAPNSFPLPSVIINGLVSIDTEALRQQIEQLVTAKDYYDPVTKGNTEFITLMDEWQGDGADAFEDRWTKLATYAHGDSTAAENVSLVSRITKHAEITISEGGVVWRCEAAQSECARFIQENLKDLRTFWQNMGIMVGGAAAGAGAGAAVGTVIEPGAGTVWGAQIGAVVGLIGGLIEITSAANAQSEQVKQGVAGIATLAGGLTLDTSTIKEIPFTAGASTTSDIFSGWKPE